MAETCSFALCENRLGIARQQYFRPAESNRVDASGTVCNTEDLKMIRIKEAILVEGRYDVNKVKQIFDTIVLETSGFGIFSDKKKAIMLRNLAEKRGLLVLTDSDSAGLVIRNYVQKIVPKRYIKHAYVPEIHGKEKRKKAPGKEHLLGVEGVPDEFIIRAVRRAGATFFDEDAENSGFAKQISKTTLYAAGLSGGNESALKRKKLLKKLELPTNLSANALIDYCNCMYSEQEFMELIQHLD